VVSIVSEQYQFLRYYIPGSLALIYFLILILANIGERIFELSFSNEALTSLVLGAFVISPAIGYVIYLFYDWILYNRIAECCERETLHLLDRWAEEERFRRGERWRIKRKELIDFALYSRLEDSDFEISDSIAETIRRFWNHINARLTSAVFVPIASVIFFGLFWSLRPLSTLNIGCTLLTIMIMGIVSACIGFPAIRTIREAFALEEYLLRAKEQAVRAYMRLDRVA